MRRLGRWAVETRAGRVASRLLMVVLIGGGAYLAVREEVDRETRPLVERLRGIRLVGPCRALGIHDPECQRQARLIFAACYVQKHECRERFGLVFVRRQRGAVEPPDARPEGGDRLQPAPTAGQQPEPPVGGGAVGEGRGEKGGQPKPPQQPEAAPQPQPTPVPPPAPPASAPAPIPAPAPPSEPPASRPPPASPPAAPPSPPAPRGPRASGGLDLCLDLIVQACLDADLGLGR